jgi:hypothetical protein
MLAAERGTPVIQEGEVVAVEKPGESRARTGGGTVGPESVLTPGGGNVVMQEASSPDPRWALAIDLSEGIYLVTIPAPSRKSSLAKLAVGSQVKCIVERNKFLLLDEKGKKHKASVRQRPK